MSEVVSRAMRRRLKANRQGRLTNEQWSDLVSEPLAPLLILLIPGAVIAGPLMSRLLLGRGVLVLLIVVLLVVVLPMILRAWRYSHAVIEHDMLYTGAQIVSRWLYWRKATLYTAKGEPIRFRCRSVPMIILRPNTAYLVYYIEDAALPILLSLAPADHPDATEWRPPAR